jgi:hypothetical protein
VELGRFERNCSQSNLEFNAGHGAAKFPPPFTDLTFLREFKPVLLQRESL